MPGCLKKVNRWGAAPSSLIPNLWPSGEDEAIYRMALFRERHSELQADSLPLMVLYG